MQGLQCVGLMVTCNSLDAYNAVRQFIGYGACNAVRRFNGLDAYNAVRQFIGYGACNAVRRFNGHDACNAVRWSAGVHAAWAAITRHHAGYFTTSAFNGAMHFLSLVVWALSACV